MRLLVFLFILFDGAQAQDAATAAVSDVVHLPKITEPVTIDGRLDEPVWSRLEPLQLTRMTPSYGGPPGEETEVFVAYDDAYLYLAGRLYDDPEDVQATTFQRDYSSENDDWFGLTIDSYNYNESGLAFYTNPAGLRLDFEVRDDAEGDLPINDSWDTFWDVAVETTEEGWFAEFRIPFSSLKFREAGDRAEMGLIVSRWIATNNEIATYPSIEPRWGFWSWTKPSIAQTVGFEGIQAANPLYVTPYALAGGQHHSRFNPSETAYRTFQDATYDVGLDLKYAVTNDLTLDVTVNTDFAQVEADDQQVNLTRFSLFFPEKRRFFQERSSLFEYGFGGPNRLFYSRRIGLHEGDPVPIIGGARLVGRAGPWDVGFLGMQTARAHGLPSENFGVLRLRRPVLNAYSYAGGMLTSRIGLDGRYNVAYGADAVLRLFGDDYLSVKWAQTYYDEIENRPIDPDAMRILLAWDRRTFSGFGYNASLSRSGPKYDPGVGFEIRENYTRLGVRTSYGWLPGEGAAFQSHRISLDGATFWRATDGSIESGDIGPSWTGSWKTGHQLTVGWTTSYEDLQRPFAIGTATVPAGSYRFTAAAVRYRTPVSELLRSDFSVTAGSFFHGSRVSASVAPNWSASKYVSLAGEYEYNRLRFPGDSFDAHIGRLRARLTFSPRYALSSFLQYTSAGDAVIANVRFRYNPREGNDLYLVYNEILNTDREGLMPVPPLTDRRTVVAKYTYTFRW